MGRLRSYGTHFAPRYTHLPPRSANPLYFEPFERAVVHANVTSCSPRASYMSLYVLYTRNGRRPRSAPVARDYSSESDRRTNVVFKNSCVTRVFNNCDKEESLS